MYLNQGQLYSELEALGTVEMSAFGRRYGLFVLYGWNAKLAFRFCLDGTLALVIWFRLDGTLSSHLVSVWTKGYRFRLDETLALVIVPSGRISRHSLF